MRLGLLLALSLTVLNAGLPKQEVLRRMTSFHNRVYGVENMLLKPFEQNNGGKAKDDVGDWMMVMAEATGFVAGNPIAAEWADSMKTLNGASDKLINARQSAWQDVVKDSLRQNPPVGLAKFDPAQIDFDKMDLARLEAAEADLQKYRAAVSRIQQDSEKQLFGEFKNRTAEETRMRKEGLEVVYVTATTLETTLDKFSNDLQALRTAKDLARMLKAHRRAYGVDNMLVQPPATRAQDGGDEVADLMQALDAFSAYVSSRMGSMAWQEPMTTLTTANNKLILARQRAWLDVVRDCLVQKPPVGLAHFDPAQIRFGRMNLYPILQEEADLQKTNQALGKITKDLESQLAGKFKDLTPEQIRNRKSALEAMRGLSVTLTSCINKFSADLAQLKAAKVEAMNKPGSAGSK